MKPSDRHPHGRGCGNPDSIAPKRTAKYDHCCRLLCCGDRLKPLVEAVRDAEKDARVEPGQREGLDFLPAVMRSTFGVSQRALEDLKEKQKAVIEALNTHLEVCAAAVASGEGIIATSRRDLLIQPLHDIDQAEQKSRVLIWFRHENRLRKIRNKTRDEQFWMDPSPPSLQTPAADTADEQFKQQNTELMELLERLDAEVASPNPTGLSRPVSRTSSRTSQVSGVFKNFELDDPVASAAYPRTLFPFQLANERCRSASPAVQSEPETPVAETALERWERVLRESEEFDKKWGPGGEVEENTGEVTSI